MRNLNLLDTFRITNKRVMELYGSPGDHTCGVFIVSRTPGSTPLQVIASSDDDWDHVSVSADKRCPTWEEMSYVKSLFFRDNETVMQLHVPAKDHINCHPHCLHLWRPHKHEIPRPPSIMVGPK